MRSDDRCPGVLRPHLAADGALVRLRLPGGRTTASALVHLSALAQQHGSAPLQLTSRAGLQVRGLPADLPATFVDGVTAAGFLPSPTHERVRNIAASPLTGVHGGLTDLRPMITELDHQLTRDASLADLPGRFLFILDDGRGDVRGLFFDLGYAALDADHGMILVGDHVHGVPTSAERAVDTMLDLARGFLRARAASPERPWHIRELSSWVSQLSGVVAVDLGPTRSSAPLGSIGLAASVQVPLSFLTPHQVEVIADAAVEDEVVITPWRGVVLPRAAGRLTDLVEAGLIAEEDSTWALLTACVGSPSCKKSRINTRAMAGSLAATPHVTGRVHLSGCERRCGAPPGSHVDLVAPDSLEDALLEMRTPG